MKEDKEKFEVMSTKIDPAMAIVWNAVCEALGTDTYHMLQHFIYAMIRMASEHHRQTPEVQKLMTLLETDTAWQTAINLCAQNGKKSIAQMILIVEEKDTNGFAMYMLDKPFMSDVRQTENVNIIIERTIEVGLKSLYKKLRLMKEDMKCEWIADLLLDMIDAQDVLNITESNRDEMKGQANYSEYGRPIEYGKVNKRKKRREIDSVYRNGQEQQRTINFTDEDLDTVNDELNDTADILDERIGRPFGAES